MAFLYLRNLGAVTPPCRLRRPSPRQGGTTSRTGLQPFYLGITILGCSRSPRRSAIASNSPAPSTTLKVRVPAGDAEEGRILSDLKEILSGHPGETPVLIYTRDGKVLKTGRELWASGDGELISKLSTLLGEGNIKCN